MGFVFLIGVQVGAGGDVVDAILNEIRLSDFNEKEHDIAIARFDDAGCSRELWKILAGTKMEQMGRFV